MSSINILAIESSCDETSAAVCQDGNILSNIIATQSIHAAYGGVVPELASRAHIQHIVPVVDQALSQANIGLEALSAIAFTQSPGLIGSLIVGCQFAKSMALGLHIPLITVQHMQAHVLANLIEDRKPNFPFLCLTVSGGHTQIVKVTAPLTMEVIGETLDDAAGEAFDKAAKLLGLPYPGGPLVDKYAQEGDPLAFKFAIPKIEGLDFSFSGLKTSILYFLQKQTPVFIENHKKDICASVQKTIIDILLQKLEKASLQTGIKAIALAGGVSANKGLRKALEDLGKKNNWQVYVPALAYCTDNAAMIALNGYYKYQEKIFAPLSTNPMARSNF